MTFAHERPFQPIHDRLPYAPIVDQKVIDWPGGALLAVWVVPNIEHYEYLPPPSVTDPYPRTPHPDVRKYSYHDYGNRVGFWRLLEVLDEFDIPCTASLNVAVLDHYPEIGDAMRRRQWDFMSHGLYNTRYLTGMMPDVERRFLDACNAVLVRHTGRRFGGMLGPNITGNAWTPDLMVDVGMRYHADWVHDERPSPLLTKSHRPLVALPYSYELNDAPLLMRSHVEGEAYADRIVSQFDVMYQDAKRDATRRGRVMCLPLHPFAIGQPHRTRWLASALRHIRRHDGVWLARASEIVDHYLRDYWETDLARVARSVT